MTDTTIRNDDLRYMLGERRHELQSAVQSGLSDARTDQHKMIGDDLEHADADTQEGLELSLLEMRAETLTRIDEALVRLDAGMYGSCYECNSEIPQRRLQALPFAVRCQACEQRREHTRGYARLNAQHYSGFSLFPDVVRP
jgi:DnaK suppressor protein